ncbi:MAG TPA: potassium-transporting ATPase subunit KdpC [Ignavibacteriaceae bacterium]|nr:potassium-transporting ATPase subunit KdpC [Ignavibacteriaceae bacterium]
MKKIIVQSFKIFLSLTILTGVIYPVFITLIGQVIFPNQSSGSLVIKDGKIIGSELLGQNFADSIYFQSRPSAINYNPLPSGASNLGLSSVLLKEQVNDRKLEFRKNNLLSDSIVIPSEMLFASGSGVDPHISVEAANMQINRIIKSRNLSTDKSKLLNKLVDSLSEYPQFGVLGNQVVNVFSLNLKLDEESIRWKTQK